MKKILFAIILLAFIGIFSGCALPTPSKPGSAAPSFTLSQSIWKSTDGGKTWKVKNKGEGKANATTVDILSFAINPYDSNNVYAGLRSGGILETVNGGETWKFINNYTSEKVYGLAIDPSDGKTLYASGVWQGKGKMFKTQDDGRNWKEIYTSPSNGPLVISLAIDKKNPNILYATTSDNEALKSADAGESWKNIYQADSPILKISIDSANSNLIYFVTNSGTIMKSADAGSSFQNVNEKINKNFAGIGGSQFTVLEADPSVSGRVYAAGSGGLTVSNDSGETWKKISTLNNPQNFPIRTLAISPKNSSEIVYGAAQASYKSVDGGESWITSQFDNKMAANVLRYDSANPDVVYLGFTK